ncbi:uncharacterized protein LOC106876236 [Octopus bimaculoides]|uniref:TNF family profile domain-containing protein n=1 Tax=Octopus bimaculoides TaxID=37653 RepID=A0A0L8GKF9_OCTBM|nr:uncharacterized protein LOC106876236 [Octopus bimaculoides]|eukprot:XP_014780204.1 PREDICTED: uncharacterized protein LOC106876236 [Octopus bimaculoides]
MPTRIVYDLNEDSQSAVTQEKYEDVTPETHPLTNEDKKNTSPQMPDAKEDTHRCKFQSYQRRTFKILFPICLFAFVVCVILSIIIFSMQRKNLSFRPESHYALFHLKTSHYTASEEASYLKWVKDEGNFKLVNGTYISIPQDGVYQINCAVQLYIPKNSTAAVTTLVLERKYNGKHYVFMKKRASFLNTPEHAIIQLSFRYKLVSNNEIFLKINKARFVRPNMPSSYLYITSLHVNNL